MWVTVLARDRQGTNCRLTETVHRSLEESVRLFIDKRGQHLPSGFGVVSITCKRRMFEIS